MTRLALALAAALIVAATSVSAETRLRYAHFMPAASWQQEELFLAWAEAVGEASEGALSVTVFPAQTLGKAPAGYDNARAGVADIAWTVQGYTAGRFPLSQIIELPGLFETAEIGSCAFQKLYDSGALDAEYAETHVLFVHVHGPGHIHTRGAPVRRLADLDGLKIRRPTSVIGLLLSELGAEPIGMPAPRIFENMERGAVDGYMLPSEAVMGFRLAEVTDYRTEFGFYALAFVAVMNKDVYESLNPAEKAAVDAHSGMPWALVAGRGFDAGDIRAEAELEGAIETFTIPEDELPAWRAAADRATAAYLAELDAAGLPGTETYAQIKSYVAECEADLG